MAIKKGNTTVWLVRDEHGDIYSAETSLNNAKAKAKTLGFLDIEIRTTTGLVSNGKVTYYDNNY